MLCEKDFVWNEYAKVKELDCQENPLNYFFYSNGLHFLAIKKGRSAYCLISRGTSFNPIYRQSNFDVLFESSSLLDVKAKFEDFIKLLILPSSVELQGRLF